MGLQFLLVTLVLSATTLIADKVPEKQSQPKWHLIEGHKTGPSKMYLDDNSIEKITQNGYTFTSGSILIVADDKSRTIVIEEKTVEFKSIVRHMVVDCSKGNVLPLINYYFAVDKPTREDKPVAAFEYVQDAKIIIPLQKNSLIYESFCPNYI